ncbi:MAG: U32 family peptidase [Bacteroidetes bacterium]|nr:U32 family peptidase [Bacteroidota bacterium]
MKRTFNGKNLELIAPAGTYEIFREIIKSRCNAVYCGGQILNMRMIRKGYNLTHEELKESTLLAKKLDKKIYITLNSLLDPKEITQAAEYLDYLQEIQPHALIIQDAAVMELALRRNITIPLHSSVMMNVHNLDMIKTLQEYGVSRVVLSREMPLAAIRGLSGQTTMELEYFVHGDMCVTHGSQCLYSSYLFGMSSNRGRCLKPCRWAYTQPEKPDAKPYPLAVKDLNLYSHLPELILSGVTSFKIEGRMRQKEFIVDLVNRYGETLDRFLDNPLTELQPNETDMEPFKKRDYSTAYAFGIPGQKNINTRGEGSGKFYSTGRMFSVPTKEHDIDLTTSAPVNPHQNFNHETLTAETAFSVRVNSKEQALLALSYQPKRIYLSTEPFSPEKLLSYEEIAELRERCSQDGCELYLALPRMMSDEQNDLFSAFFNKKPLIDGILITHSGAFRSIATKQYPVICDTTMNIYNAEAVRFYNRFNIQGWTPSLELPYQSLLSLPESVKALGCTVEGEIVLHGLPTLMYMDHDVSDENADRVELQTRVSQLTIRRDWWNRYHLLPHKELSLLPRLPELIQAGYRTFRLELQAYDLAATEKVLLACRCCLQEPLRGASELSSLNPIGGGFTYGAHKF